jgi:hypothetical protein
MNQDRLSRGRSGAIFTKSGNRRLRIAQAGIPCVRSPDMALTVLCKLFDHMGLRGRA